MTRTLNRAALFGLLLVFGFVIPVTKLEAMGPPLPPPGLFQGPPTPAPVVLPTFTPAPPAASAPSEVEPAPAPITGLQAAATPQVVSRLFFPRLEKGARASSQSATHEDPLADSFSYIAKPGDTFADLAMDLGRDEKAMLCVRRSDGSMVTSLVPGEAVVIPALGDLCHQVKAGETLATIATWYGVTAESISAANPVQTAVFAAGQTLLIPDARSSYRNPEAVNVPRQPSTNWRFGDGNFIWPVERGRVWVSQGFRHGKHMAVDMATVAGALVSAADTGVVTKAGWTDNGLGYRIVIDHGIDYVTLYAHLDEYYVKEGDIVKKGDALGRVGSTGNSTGPHLHFEVRDYGYLIDPLLVLPH